MAKKLVPLFDRVLVKPDEDVKVTRGGVYLPETAAPQTTSRSGVVQSIGPGRVMEFTGRIEPMQVEVGDRVVFGLHAGINVEIDEVKLVILRQAEIGAKVEVE